MLKKHVRGTTTKSQDVIAAAKPNLSDAEPRDLEEPFTETETSLLRTAMTMDGPTELPLYKYGRGPTDSPTPEEAYPIKTGRVRPYALGTSNEVGLSKSQTAPGLSPSFSSGRTWTSASEYTTRN
jgi:hypothetical protein